MVRNFIIHFKINYTFVFVFVFKLPVVANLFSCENSIQNSGNITDNLDNDNDDHGHLLSLYYQ